MSDQLQTMIDEGQRKLSKLEEELRKIDAKRNDCRDRIHDLKIQIAAFEQAAALRPAASTERVQKAAALEVAEPEAPIKRKGRQAGSISNKWRLAMADMVGAGNEWMDFDKFYLLTRARLNLKVGSVRERVRSYTRMGYVEESDSLIRIGQKAIERFDLQKNSASPAPTGEAVKSSGASNTGEYLQPTSDPDATEGGKRDLANHPGITGSQLN